MKHIHYVHGQQVDPKPRQDFLELAGFEVTAMEDARRCISMLEGKRPDLIVADTLLQGMTGFELCEEVRRRCPAQELPIVLCTTIYKGSVYSEEAARLGVQRYLVHPLDLKEFVDVVQELLGLDGKMAA